MKIHICIAGAPEGYTHQQQSVCLDSDAPALTFCREQEVSLSLASKDLTG